MAKDLKIRIISHIMKPVFLALYQQDIKNVENFKLVYWMKGVLSQGGSIYTVFPQKLEAQGRVNIDNIIYNTKIIDINYDNSYEIYGAGSYFDIRNSSESLIIVKTIDIYNKTSSRKEAVILRGGKPLFYVNLRPDSKVKFSIDHSISMAICDLEADNENFEFASASQTFYINYGIQNYLTISLQENIAEGSLFIETDFNKFSSPNI